MPLSVSRDSVPFELMNRMQSLTTMPDCVRTEPLVVAVSVRAVPAVPKL